MIEAQKLNRETIYLNPDLILWMEAVPDTILTFSNGEKLTVLTKPETIIERIMNHKKQIASGIENKVKTQPAG